MCEEHINYFNFLKESMMMVDRFELMQYQFPGDWTGSVIKIGMVYLLLGPAVTGTTAYMSEEESCKKILFGGEVNKIWK